MFQNSMIVFQQILVMFLLMLVGYYIFRKRVFDNDTTKSLSNLLNRYVMPCCVLRAFQRPFDAALGRQLGLTFVCAAAIFALSIIAANSLFRPSGSGNYPDRRVCAVLTNNGFMALPLLDAMFGADGVFLGSAHIACMAIVTWTYAASQVSGGRAGKSPRDVFFNPGVLAVVAGIVLFISPVKLPVVVFTAVDFLGDINTPLAMLVLGGFLAQVDLRQCFNDKSIWILSAVRLLLIPALSVLLLIPIPIEPVAKLTLMVGVAAPTAIASAMFGQLYGSDYLFSTRAIALTTLLSVVTLPATIALMENVLRLL